METDPPTSPPPRITSSSNEALWRAAIGGRVDYYVPRFAKYEGTDRSFPRWHWPAFFVQGWWALYRKAWGAAALFFCLPVLVVPLVVIGALSVAPGSSEAIRIGATFLVCGPIAALLANVLYYRRVKSLVQRARRQYPDPTAQLAFLRAKASTLGIAKVTSVGLVLTLLSLVVVGTIPALLASPFFTRGVAFQEKGDNEQAIREYDQALGIDPNNSVTLMNRGNAYRDKGDYAPALRDYDQSARLLPRDPLVFLNRGVAYSRMGDINRSIASDDEAIRLNPKNALFFSNRGYAHLMKGDYALANEDFDRALQLNPNLSHAIVNRALAYYIQGQFSAAVPGFARAQQLEPRSLHRLLWLYLARARAQDQPAQMALRDELAQGGAKLDLAQWPGPVFSFFAGAANEQAIFSAANGASALKCEAYVFVAEDDLLEGRKENAAKMLRAAIATCVTWSPYFQVAKTELVRLNH